jgi:DNA polymerase zeta
LTLSINHALALSYRRNPYDSTDGTFVAQISLVKGIPFYGYNVGYKFFLKIYLFNPTNMTRFADLLNQGAILARVFQPYESHMQYLAQWMVDYNLFGCGYIDCEKVRFRGAVPECAEPSEEEGEWNEATILPEWRSLEDEFPRQSHCAIEIDLCIQDIMNRREVRPRHLHHDFMERFQELGADEKFVHSMAGLWKDETIRRKKRMGIVNPGSSPFPPEALISMSADPRAQKGNWIHEEEFREMMEAMITEETKLGPEEEVGFDGFIKSADKESHIQTAFESVDELYPENLRKLEAIVPNMFSSTPVSNGPPALVNAESISRANDEDDGYHSDEDTAKKIALSLKKLQQQTVKGTNDDAVGVPIPNSDSRAGDAGMVKHSSVLNGEPLASNADEIQKPVGANDLSLLGSDGVSSIANSEKTSSDIQVSKRKDFQNEEILEELEVIKKRKLFQSSPADQRRSKEEAVSMANGTLGTRKVATPRRVTFEVAPSGSQKSRNDQLKDGDEDSPLISSQLSQSSIKAQGSKPPSSLFFSVVKNPHDPDTGLQISQQGEYSNTQAVRTPASKSAVSTDKDSPVTPWTIPKSGFSTVSPSTTPISSELVKVTKSLKSAFHIPTTTNVLCFNQLPPTKNEVSSTILNYGLPPVVYQDAYYSDEKDVPERPREYAGREFKLESTTLPFLPDFDPTGTSLATAGEKVPVVRDKIKEEIQYNRKRKQCSLRNWEIGLQPPTRAEVEKWLAQEEAGRAGPKKPSTAAADQTSVKNLSQIDGPTQKNKHGFKYSRKAKSTSVEHETQYMSIMSLEVHVNTRENFAPDPAEDEVVSIFWCIQSNDGTAQGGYQTGILTLSAEDGIAQTVARSTDVLVETEEDELELLNKMIDIVRYYDPDILTGYEVQNGSWGYLIERARVKYEFNLPDEFSRMKSQSHGRFGKDADRWGFTHTSTIRVTGRHMINIWRAMRGELNLLQYTMENVVFHILHKRIPHYSFADLTRWYTSGKSRHVGKAVTYFLSRVQLNLKIMDANELIPRTSEQARLLGVDFFSVFSRGSQFKVESLMFRIAKPENYILISPSRKQVGQQNALECLPLVMEPQSAFYASPVLVLDFQSLYPSVMIAYNYCYSTFLGRITGWRGTNKMGFTDFKRQPRLLEIVKEYVNVAPNGIMYVRPEMRKSLLAKMLGEILETRVMVKSGMKEDKNDKTLQRLLNNRQLALKLIANVTYGYTSASFSGRMPCAEIADSIVQTGRETLEKAIALIHSVERWGAEVVYGDTDSLFVHLKGRTRDQAFEIGKEIAEEITNVNPRPIKLKFEKVYHPCVLLAKKRYVGFKYEHPSQTEPEFDAKGIETVRRDGTPAEQKIEEKTLKILFRSQDLSEVKAYFQAQCSKIMQGRVSVQDFLFAKEVKLGNYSDKGIPPPGALIATKRMLQDPRMEPQYGERVPYVVITGAPGARLIDRCVDPERLLKDDQVELDAEYYINKNLIPPLERIFNLVGANVRSWFDEMPKVQRVRTVRAPAQLLNMATEGTGIAKKTLESYLHTTTCLVCRSKLPPPPPGVALPAQVQEAPLPICEECASKPAKSLYALRTKVHKAEEKVKKVLDICRSCSGLAFGEKVQCDSRDCPVFYTRIKERAALGSLKERTSDVVQVMEKSDTAKEIKW